MTKYLLILLGFVLWSCEKPGPNTQHFRLSIKATYLKGKPDIGATAYIFKDVNVHLTDLKFDGKGNLYNTKKTVPYTRMLTLDENGEAGAVLLEGLYAVVCVSNNYLKDGSNYWISTSIILDGQSDDLTFEFDKLP